MSGKDDMDNYDDYSSDRPEDENDFIFGNENNKSENNSFEKDYDLNLWNSYITGEEQSDNGSNENGDDDVIYSSTEKMEEAKKRRGIVTEEKKPKKKRKTAIVLRNTALSVFLILIITGCLVIGVFSVYVFGFVEDDVNFDLNNLKLDYTSVIYSLNRDTGEYEVYSEIHGTQNRIWKDGSEFSSYLGDAIVSIEDKRFYSHEGVDWKRTFSAFANMFFDIYGGTQGGSTLTQQLVKTITGDNEQTPRRKIQEIMRARKIEQNYTKSTILECYINTVHFGNGCDGIQVASEYYFGKDASQLSLLECAALAATIQTPASKNPIDGPESNKERREICLSEMLSQGYITQEEYDQAMSEELVLVDHSSGSTDDGNEAIDHSQIYDYFVETVIEDVTDDLMETKGYTKEEAQNAILTGGLQIYSTVDPTVQNAMQEVFNDSDNFAKVRSSEVQPQAAMTIMDYSGHIIGIMGGRGEKTVNLGLNRATQSKRQPGSSIKPLASYSPAIEYNQVTYSTKIVDSPLKYNGKNYPDSGSGAYVTIQNALERSLNCVAVRLVNDLTIDKSYEFLEKRYGISTLVPSTTNSSGEVITDYTLSSLALGGMVNGVTTEEMAAAYSCFGNLGVYWEPTTYTIIKNTFGDTVLEQENNGVQAISQETANIMNELMQRVVSGSSGTARPAAFGGWPIFGKTGTTNANYDRWFVAGTPYYVGACWYGFDTPDDMGGTSYNPCIYFWKPVMEKIHENLELCDFNESSEVSYRYYCTETGYLATDNCGSTALGYFKNSYLPICKTHGGTLLPEVTKPSPIGGKYVDLNIGAKLPVYDTVSSSEESSDSAKSTVTSSADVSSVVSVVESSVVETSSQPPASSADTSSQSVSSEPKSSVPESKPQESSIVEESSQVKSEPEESTPDEESSLTEQ